MLPCSRAWGHHDRNTTAAERWRGAKRIAPSACGAFLIQINLELNLILATVAYSMNASQHVPLTNRTLQRPIWMADRYRHYESILRGC